MKSTGYLPAVVMCQLRPNKVPPDLSVPTESIGGQEMELLVSLPLCFVPKPNSPRLHESEELNNTADAAGFFYAAHRGILDKKLAKSRNKQC